MKNKLACMLAVFVCALSVETFGQVGIGTDAPNTKAVLDLQSPNNNQGFLVPRLTTAQRTASTFTSILATTEKGLLVFDTDTNKFYYWSGTGWTVIEDSTGTDSQTLSLTAKNLTISGGNTISLASVDSQDLSLAGTTLSLTNDASTVNLAGFIQDLTLTGNVLSLSGDATTVNLASYIQNLTLTGTNLAISGGNSVNLSAFTNTDAQSLSLGTITGTSRPINISGGTGVTIDVADNDNSITNEIQNLSLTGSNLSISSGNTISLSSFTNTDSQNLGLGTISGTNRPITISGGTGVTIDVADNDNSVTNEIQNLSLGAVTGTNRVVNISSGTGVTIDVADNDNSITNEIQALSIAGTNLTLSNGGGTVALPAPPTYTAGAGIAVAGTVISNTGDLSATNEIQNLTSTAAGVNRTILISGGTSTTFSVADNDNSITNEIQNLNQVLNAGNNAGNTEAVNFSAIGIGTDKPMGNLHVVGSQIVSQLVIDDSYEVKPADYSIFVTNAAKPLTIQLPPIEGDPNYVGRVIIIRSINTEPVRILADEPAKDFIDFYGTQYDMARFGDPEQNNRFHTMTFIATKLPGGNRWIMVSGLKGQL